MKTLAHVCQHTDEGEEACDSCHFMERVPAMMPDVKIKIASKRGDSLSPEGLPTGARFHLRTDRLLKALMKENQAERKRAHRTTMFAHLKRHEPVYGLQHLAYL